MSRILLLCLLIAAIACDGGSQARPDGAAPGDASVTSDGGNRMDATPGDASTSADARIEGDAGLPSDAGQPDGHAPADASVDAMVPDDAGREGSLEQLTHLRIDVASPMPVGARQPVTIIGVGPERERDLTGHPDLALRATSDALEVDGSDIMGRAAGTAQLQGELPRPGLTSLLGTTEVTVAEIDAEGIRFRSEPVAGSWQHADVEPAFVPMVPEWTTTLRPYLRFAGGFAGRIPLDEISWEATGTSAAVSLTDDGFHVRADRLGTTTLQVEWSEPSDPPATYTAELEVRVRMPTGPEVTEAGFGAHANCEVGSSKTLGAGVSVTTGEWPDPGANLSSRMTWSSSDPERAVVSGCDARRCRVECLGAGDVEIHGTSSWAGERSVSASLSVWRRDAIERIEVSPTPATVVIDDFLFCELPPLTVTVYPVAGAPFTLRTDGDDPRADHIRVFGRSTAQLECCDFWQEGVVYYHGHEAPFETACP